MLKVIAKSSLICNQYEAVITLPTSKENIDKIVAQLGDITIKDLEVENLAEGLLKFERELFAIKDLYVLNSAIQSLNELNRRNYLAVLHYVKNLNYKLVDAIIENEGYPAVEIHEKSMQELAIHYVNSVWCYDGRMKRIIDMKSVEEELIKYEKFGEVEMNGKKFTVRKITV